MHHNQDSQVRTQLLAWSLILYGTLTATKYFKLLSVAMLAGYFTMWALAGVGVVALAVWLGHRSHGRRGLALVAVLVSVVACIAFAVRPKPFLVLIHATRADLTVVLGLALVADGAYQLFGRGSPRVFRALLAVVFLPLIGLATLELGLFALTGSEAGWYELAFALGNPRTFASLVGQYIGARSLPYAVPLVLGLAVLAIRPGMVDKLRPLTSVVERRLVAPGSLLVFAVVVALLFVAPEADVSATLAYRTGGNTFLQLVHDLPPTGGLGGRDPESPGMHYDVEPFRTIRHGDTTPRNVLYVVLESVRADYTTPYSPGLRTTPFLAEIAENALVVDNMYSVIPFSTKAMPPMFCGVYPKIDMAVMLEDERLPDSEVCLPELLEGHGYRTVAFTTFCGLDEACVGWDDLSGFEIRLRETGFDEIVTQEELDMAGRPRVFPGGVAEEALLPPIEQWLRELPASTPFAMAVWTMSTHAPFSVSPDFAGWPAEVGSNGARPPRPTETIRGLNVDDYYLALQYVDRFVARLVDVLDRVGRLDSTVIAIVGDHGIGFGEHSRQYYERVLYEEGIHVPAILAGPGIPAGRVAGRYQHIDLAPTIVDALGLEITEGSLPPRTVSLLGPVDPERTLYFSCYSEGRCMALLRGDLKYHYFYRYRPMEVYDLAVDPRERDDLAPEMDPAELAAVEQELLAWRRAVNRYYEGASGQ